MLRHTGLGKGTAAGLTATAAVGTGKHLGHIVDERVFHHLKLLRHNVQHHGKQYAEGAENNYRNQDLLSHIVIFYFRIIAKITI